MVPWSKDDFAEKGGPAVAIGTSAVRTPQSHCGKYCGKYIDGKYIDLDSAGEDQIRVAVLLSERKSGSGGLQIRLPPIHSQLHKRPDVLGGARRNSIEIAAQQFHIHFETGDRRIAEV